METIPTVAERRAESWREELRQGMKAKERTAIHRVEMNELDPDYRSHNNEEVNQGLSEEQALREAQRCLDCVTPTCMEGCPVSIQIPSFIKNIERGNFLGAARAMIVYRRSEEEMPARIEEVKHAKEEGVEFLTLHNPIEYLGDENGRVKHMRLQRMELGEPDASGRRRPVPVEGAVETIDVDEVIVSVGVSPNPLIPQAFAGLEISKRGTIIVGEADMRSSLADVYAGGDIVRGGATVILAMGDGRRAAAAMDEALQERKS